MLSGDNGILQRATIAKENTTNSQITEKIQLAYHAALTGGQGSYTKESLESELEKEFGENNYNVDDADSENWILTGKEKGKEQSVTVPAGKVEKEPEGLYRSYNIGDRVTISGENFFVIEKSNSNASKLKLLAEKNVNTSTNKQDDNANTVAFDDNDGNIYANSTIKAFVDAYATALVSDGIALEDVDSDGNKARLMSIDEVKSFGLGSDEQTHAYAGFSTEEAPDFINTTEYWLETSSDGISDGEARMISKYNNQAIAGSSPTWIDWAYGVRPVIVILKDYL